MTKAKVWTSPNFDAFVSSAVKADSHNMNQLPLQTRPKDTHLKAAGNRGSTNSATVRGKDGRRIEKTRLLDTRSVTHCSKASGRRSAPDASCKESVKPPSIDSSLESSDCTSEENRASNRAQSKECEPGNDNDADVDWKETVTEMFEDDSFTGTTLSPKADVGERRNSPLFFMDRKWNLSASEALWEFSGGKAYEELMKEIEELRSENEYLKDEVEELRIEMQEMRDLYKEEDAYQLQEFRQQLDQANKTCRILQYRLRKAERRSLRIAQTGQVDNELIRTLEHDVRVAKSVSIRLHQELESIQKKSAQLEWENEELREQLQNLEVAKQVLQAEMDKSREVFSQNSLKRRSLRSTSIKTDKKLSPQDDEDLKCQLYFAKEESALMCKKLTKMAVECEGMRSELSKYKYIYGEVDSSQSAAGTTNSTHTCEAEVKVHLRLVEEEATLLSSRIVELEVENQGLRAEMNEMRERIGWDQEEEDELMEEQLPNLTTSLSFKNKEKANAVMDCDHSDTEERSGDQVHTICLRSEDFPINQILKKEPVGVERNPLVLEKFDESVECSRKATCRQDLISLKDLDVFFAVRDQAVLVKSIIQFLITPAKNGFLMPNHNLISSFPLPNKLEVNSQCGTPPWVVDPMLSPLNNGLEILESQLQLLVAKLDLVKSLSTDHESKTMISGMDEDTKTEKKNEKDAQNSGDRQMCSSCLAISTEEQLYKQDSLELLTLQLHRFLQQVQREERPVAACTTTFKLEDTTDPKMALQKDYVEKIQQLLPESSVAIMDVSQQLKMCKCEKRELKIECQKNRDWNNMSKVTESHRLKISLKGEETNSANNKSGPPTQIPKKNWQYLSKEAALMDRDDSCRTWDCPIMSPSCPELDLKQSTVQKSYTAPEKTSIRIYYSPPLIRRFHHSAVTTKDMLRYKKSESQETHSLSKQINEANVCGKWQTVLPFQYSSMTKQGPFTDIKHFSGLQCPGVSSQVCLSYSGCEVSSNLSDDMKEMTVNVLERRRGPDSVSHGVGVVTTSTQTHAQPQVNSVGLQTENYHMLYAGKNGLSKVNTLVSAHTKRMSTSLEKIPRPLEKLSPCSNSVKLHRRHSSPFYSSCSSSTSNSSSSHTLSSMTLSTTSLRSENKEHIVWGPPKYSSGSSDWVRSSTTRPSSASGEISDKSAGRKTAGVYKYGLVQEFLRNVCGRGEKPQPGVEKTTMVHKDYGSSKRLKKTEGTPSRIPTVPLVRSDNVTRTVNRRFMKPGRKYEPGSGQTLRQDQSQHQTNKTPKSKAKGFGPVTQEDGSCGCSSRTLTSCFARVSRTNIRHAQGHCKLHPSAAGGKGNLLSQ